MFDKSLNQAPLGLESLLGGEEPDIEIEIDDPEALHIAMGGLEIDFDPRKETDEEFDEGLMRAYVIKSRNGRPRFIVPMKIDYGTLRMEETEAFETEDADL